MVCNFQLSSHRSTASGLVAQTPQQRRANAKFAKDNESRMGKSEDQIKKRTKEAPKSPISPIWLILLGFVVFGGIVFEVLSRMFGF
ncbi:hypothetical protein CORC01_11487 [Colletotrichum orchidophilum]|uniref:Stress-associated endoplasmic reticulum protein n=1 Tax=Colletotrichum orchidophilum TaxID=1209926 RepID=A0A1G4AVG7_9PEZI|nr:uncharacterized protein CORC01_11487 [Colletotrichum orchidophilum]OHE93170.1 hypothetical protein CORC01_11487 [Colletotrichum orchidophilum]